MLTPRSYKSGLTGAACPGTRHLVRHIGVGSCISEEEINVLTALRSKCIRGIRTNFKSMYKTCLHCPLQCNTEEPQHDTQEHVLQCKKLKGSNMDIDYVYTEGVEQSEIARQFSELMRQRTTLLEGETTPSSCCLPGASFLDPSTVHGAPVTVQ